MRASVAATLGAMILGCGLAGCSWGQFDDLGNSTWVTSTEKPDIKSSDYAIGIVRGKLSGDGGALGVLGNGQATYSTIGYSATGDAKPNTGSPTLAALFGIGSLDPQPIILASPVDDEISIIVNSGGSSIAVLQGTDPLIAGQIFGPLNPDAATYVRTATKPQVFVASDGVVYLTYFDTTPQTKCKLADAGASVQVKAMAAVANGGSDDILVWTTTGKLLKYPSSVIGGCATMQEPTGPGTDTGFSPGPGAQILMIGGRYAVLQGHNDAGDGFLGLYDGTTQAALGPPITSPKLYSAAVMTIGTTSYVVAGYPTADVDGVNAGQVTVYTLDGGATPTAINPAPALQLSDAQPESNQTFGRSVAVMPFNGQPTIAVAASNEVFLYFQTSLYSETRQGR